jgi:hypothetical protein
MNGEFVPEASNFCKDAPDIMQTALERAQGSL